MHSKLIHFGKVQQHAPIATRNVDRTQTRHAARIDPASNGTIVAALLKLCHNRRCEAIGQLDVAACSVELSHDLDSHLERQTDVGAPPTRRIKVRRRRQSQIRHRTGRLDEIQRTLANIEVDANAVVVTVVVVWTRRLAVREIPTRRANAQIWRNANTDASAL